MAGSLANCRRGHITTRIRDNSKGVNDMSMDRTPLMSHRLLATRVKIAMELIRLRGQERVTSKYQTKISLLREVQAS